MISTRMLYSTLRNPPRTVIGRPSAGGHLQRCSWLDDGRGKRHLGNELRTSPSNTKPSPAQNAVGRRLPEGNGSSSMASHAVVIFTLVVGQWCSCRTATADRDSRRSRGTAANGSTQSPFDRDAGGRSLAAEPAKALPPRTGTTAASLGLDQRRPALRLAVSPGLFHRSGRLANTHGRSALGLLESFDSILRHISSAFCIACQLALLA
jgi:hypothetical protein